MVDFRIHTFLVVCKYLNYTHAADELNLTQPAVSQHIRYLEQYYGVKLFTYNNKNLTLTTQGQYLKKYMETLSHDSKQIHDTMQNIHKRKRIKLGATLSIGEYFLPERLSMFMKRHPQLDLSVTIADTAALLSMLDEGVVDYVLCEGYFNKNAYSHMLIKTEEMSIFCASDYNINNIKDLKSLFFHHLFIREKGSGTREIFERYLHEKNYSLDNFSRISDFTSPHLIVNMIASGLGISVLYYSVGETGLKNGSLKEIKIPDFHISHEFNAIWKKDSVFESEYKEIIKEIIT